MYVHDGWLQRHDDGRNVYDEIYEQNGHDEHDECLHGQNESVHENVQRHGHEGWQHGHDERVHDGLHEMHENDVHRMYEYDENDACFRNDDWYDDVYEYHDDGHGQNDDEHGF